MTLTSNQKIWTDKGFMALPDDGHRYELVNGELIDLGNSGMKHDWIASNLMILLGSALKVDFSCTKRTKNQSFQPALKRHPDNNADEGT